MLSRLHAYLGLALVLPLFVWAVTGLIFVIKPGYEQAYERLNLAHRPLVGTINIEAQPNWQQLQLKQSTIGQHLLVTTATGELLHLNADTLQAFPLPNTEQLEQLFRSATGHNRTRYGEISNVVRAEALIRIHTTTNVELELHWPTLQVQQIGADTRFIDRLYRLHYLQWSPSPIINSVAVLSALLALLGMCVVGLRMLVVFHHKEQP